MASKSIVEVIRRVVSCIRDPRKEGRTLHSLFEIVVMALCGVIAGCDGWQAIEDHANDRIEWFSKFLELKHGVPSHDTFQRLFERLWPQEFQRLLLEVAKELHGMLSGKNISIDGKTIRGSYDKALGQGQVHVVSAYVGAYGVPPWRR